jgi:hypothetical protein
MARGVWLLWSFLIPPCALRLSSRNDISNAQGMKELTSNKTVKFFNVVEMKDDIGSDDNKNKKTEK